MERNGWWLERNPSVKSETKYKLADLVQICKEYIGDQSSEKQDDIGK